MLSLGVWMLTLGVAGYVIACGSGELRTVIVILICAYVSSFVFYSENSANWIHYPAGVFFTDVAALALLFFIALRSKRHWPLLITALHIMPVATPLVALLGHNLVSNALGWTQGIWSYLQLAVMSAATREFWLNQKGIRASTS